ncbi:MAG: ATP-binding protein [Candidatus Omnitrophica bacterium]|nr:ATP-binding protein [Candidatus Omnitrophota bacterium]
MRRYHEQCLRNLQDKMLILGFEEFDIFLVIGTVLGLQLFKVNTLVIWVVGGTLAGVLRFIKRGKPSKYIEHGVQWFFKPKVYTAIGQSVLDVIKGRTVDIRLNSLQELLPYSHFEDEFLVLEDGSLSCAYLVEGPVIENYSKEELIGYTGRIESFLNHLPERMNYQVILDMDGDYQEELGQHKVIRSENTLIRGMHKERVRKFEEIIQNQKLRRFRCHFLINCPPFPKANAGIFKTKKKAFSEEDIRFLKAEFKRALDDIESGLRSTDLTVHKLSNQEVAGFTYGLLNPDRVREGIGCPKLKSHDSFVRQVCCSDLSIDDQKGEFIQFGGYYHKYVTLKVLPELTFPAMLFQLRYLSFKEFHAVFNIDTPSKEWGRKTIETLRRREYGNLLQFMGLPNKEAQVKVEQYEALLEELQQTNQKLFRCQLTIHVYGDTVDQVKQRCTELINLFSALNGAEMHDERWGGVTPAFLSTLPGWTKESTRWLMLKTLHLADFLPVFSEFKGSGNAECLFFNTTQGLASFDPFSNDIAAFNIVVVGATGSGKSFTINQIINQYSKNRPIEIFIDIGGSYRRQTLLKGGEYIDLGLTKKFTLNVFELSGNKPLRSFTEEEQNEIIMVKTKSIIQMMGGLKRFNEADQIVEDYLFRSLRFMYERIDRPVLSDFRGVLKSMAESNKQYQKYCDSVIGLLGNWFKGGQYGTYTDGPSTISLDKDVICFDLKGMEKFTGLQTVMLTIITNYVWNKVLNEPDRRKLVVFDECWKLLSTPESAAFIAECYRTFRKYGASAISVTQSLNDFLVGGLENAILGNSNTRFILRQNSVPTVQGIVDYFHFNESEHKQIESLQIKKGEGAEVFFSQSKGLQSVSGKMVIYPTPIEYWVATTDAKDVSYYNQKEQENPGLDMYEVIKLCAKEYPNGFRE